MTDLDWTTTDAGTWRARNGPREYVICHDPATETWTLSGPDRTWDALPGLEVAMEVAAIADEVHHDDDRMTSYRVVTAAGAQRGETFGADSDDGALDVLRARRRAGNLPLAPFRLETDDGRVVGAWRRAAEIPSGAAGYGSRTTS